MAKTICGIRCSNENPLTFELKFNDDGMGLTLDWYDSIFSETLIIGNNGETMPQVEYTINNICSEIRAAIMSKAPNPPQRYSGDTMGEYEIGDMATLSGDDTVFHAEE